MKKFLWGILLMAFSSHQLFAYSNDTLDTLGRHPAGRHSAGRHPAPNIVFIMVDQLGAATLHAYGGPVNSTPTLDKLANNGMRFDRYYATIPVCAPNRATILTGRSPVVHGVLYNNSALDPQTTPTYAMVLQAHGYRTGSFGKMHQTPMSEPEPDDLKFLGFDEAVVSEDPKWGPWIDWVKEKHPEYFEMAVGMAWGGARREDQKQYNALHKQAEEKFYEPLFDKSGWEKMYASPLPAEVHDNTFITNVSLDFVQRHVENHPDQPFFCHVSYVDPHDPYNPPAPYDTMFRAEDMPAPIDQHWSPDSFPILKASQKWQNFGEIADNEEAMKQMRAYYHGSLRFLDDQIARIVNYLEEQGVMDNTIIVFTTDHGEMLGDHGLITKGVKHYDRGIRCPLIVYGAGIREGVSDRLSCSLDLFPTFLEWANVDENNFPPNEGKSLAKVSRRIQDNNSWEEIAVAFRDVESVITDDYWRLTRYVEDDAGQMFNLKEDPKELNNLYSNPRYAGKKQELLERLVKITTRPHRIPQYRNLPYFNGKKHYFPYKPVDGDWFLEGPPLYQSEGSSALEEKEK